jgi:DNA helicase-2/ATP-dependent DNA helicase PcrA
MIASTLLQTLSDAQQEVLRADGHALVVGKPGTGKTTVALLKAVKFATDNADGQVLFLSFSNSAVQRIRAASRLRIPRAIRARLEFNTFHGFAYDVMRSHAKLR